MKADIDYGFSEANTTYGIIGVKVWVYKGDNLGRDAVQEAPAPEREDRRNRRPAKPAGRRSRKNAEGAKSEGRQRQQKPAAAEAPAKEGE